jgi:hypothetical protein
LPRSQNTHFELGFEKELIPRFERFNQIWGSQTVPPAETMDTEPDYYPEAVARGLANGVAE